MRGTLVQVNRFGKVTIRQRDDEVPSTAWGPDQSHTLARSGRAAVAPAAVGAYIGAAYWFTSSTSFANPAVTIGRAFTGTFAAPRWSTAWP